MSGLGIPDTDDQPETLAGQARGADSGAFRVRSAAPALAGKTAGRANKKTLAGCLFRQGFGMLPGA